MIPPRNRGFGLKARDEEMRNVRTAANERRQKRHKDLLPRLTHFGDHLTPAVLLSMNTGLRRGEVLKLRWACVDFERRLLTVEGRNAKNRQTRHVPLNEEAMSALRRWREQSGSGTRLFAVATGFRTAWEKLLKRATITRFRWHDLRHHFASRLVQHGVPLNTVRDLLGHSSVAMSLRYAHLTPDQRREAVAKRCPTTTGILQRGWLERSDRSNLIPCGGVRERRLRAAFSCHGLSLGRRTGQGTAIVPADSPVFAPCTR